MKYLLPLLLCIILFACKQTPVVPTFDWQAFDETERLAKSQDHESGRMQFKLLQSKVLDHQAMWNNVLLQLDGFGEEEYKKLHPLIYEKNILQIQSSIEEEKLSYENLTKWYLHRILKFETDSLLSLNAIISINPNAVEEAKKCDEGRANHPIFGMPILLKDNIGTNNMKTTAGAFALKDNQTASAFIVDQITNKGGIILAKVNLSEWAYYFCTGCPLGYSAIGGQSLNPYGSGVFETGGSSAGSGIATAANYGVAAVGTETSGSILSPSSQNSLVGLKPTIGLLSRSGIVPISSTLDTPGPMTKNVTDNAILLSAMTGKDSKDPMTNKAPSGIDYLSGLSDASLDDLRFGVNKSFLEDSIYNLIVEKISNTAATTIEFTPGEISFPGFITFLNGDMIRDLPKYMEEYASANTSLRTINDVVEFNKQDTTLRAPYGQQLFEGMAVDSTSEEEFEALKKEYHEKAVAYFETTFNDNNLDAILSINNYNAGQAAMAQYPCLTVPMGYRENGEPRNLTFIARPFEEDKLLRIAAAFESTFDIRKPPVKYVD